MPDMITPALFGITRSNRDFADPYYWGKNQFNSSFPVALACYMQSRQIPLVYVTYKNKTGTSIGAISTNDMFGSTKPSHELYFSFESRFDAFRNHVHDEPPSIDLVVCDGVRENQIRPLEIKLTTLPDNTTESLEDGLYGTELVIRSATTRYLALSIVGNIQRKLARVRQIFEPALATIRDWDNKAEMALAAPKI
jgi:HindVP restriction endonuclease